MNPSPAGEPRDRLRAFLERTRNSDGGWAYYAGKQSRIEPTAWAVLALGLPADQTPLTAWQRADGLLVEPSTGLVNFGFNGIAALALSVASAEPAARAVVRALVANKGLQTANSPVIKQDGNLQAWSWNEGTISWVEPTAWCLLAVKRVADVKTRDVAARIDEAERLLADRATAGGGWNYGNSEVYGKHLAAHVPATATGVLAMQDLKDMVIVRDAVRFLVQHARSENSSSALAHAWLALRAVGADPSDVGDAMESRVAVAEEFGNVAVAAMLLYALEARASGNLPRAVVL